MPTYGYLDVLFDCLIDIHAHLNIASNLMGAIMIVPEVIPCTICTKVLHVLIIASNFINGMFKRP